MMNLLCWLGIIVLLCYVRVQIGNAGLNLIDFLDELSKKNHNS